MVSSRSTLGPMRVASSWASPSSRSSSWMRGFFSASGHVVQSSGSNASKSVDGAGLGAVEGLLDEQHPLDGDHGGRVHDAAGHQQLLQVVDVVPDDPDGLEGVGQRRALQHDIVGREQPAGVAEQGCVGTDAAQGLPGAAAVAGLLQQLATGRCDLGLPFVDPASRQLQRQAIDAMAVLLHQDHLAHLRDRDDDREVREHDAGALLGAARCGDVEGVDGEDGGFVHTGHGGSVAGVGWAA